jgi:hypothetical protein
LMDWVRARGIVDLRAVKKIGKVGLEVYKKLDKRH